MPKERVYFIDNIRVLLTVLIILQHLSITYGAPGGWYYQEGQPGALSFLLYAMFTSINQAFIMGFFSCYLDISHLGHMTERERCPFSTRDSYG